MSNRVKAEPSHIRLVTAQLMKFMADTLERDGVTHMTVADMRALAKGLEDKNTRK